jgi:hypothetical protein
VTGSIVGAAVAVLAIGGLIFLAKRGKGPLNFEIAEFDANPAAFNNPLYQEYSPQQVNPLYEPPEEEIDLFV